MAEIVERTKDQEGIAEGGSDRQHGHNVIAFVAEIVGKGAADAGNQILPQRILRFFIGRTLQESTINPAKIATVTQS